MADDIGSMTPFTPVDFGTWSASPEGARIEDPLQKVREYDNHLRKSLYREGLYTEEAEKQIVQAGADQALRAGLVADPAEYAPPIAATAPDDNFIASALIGEGNTEKASAIYKLQSFRTRADTAPETLARAEQEAALDPTEVNRLTKKAVRTGKLPFAVVKDDQGNQILEVDPELGALSREDILDLADTVPGGVDPRVLPMLEKQLTRAPGSNYTAAQARQESVFAKFIAEKGKTDDFLAGQIDDAVSEYSRAGNLSDDTRSALGRTLAALDVDNEFSPASRARYVEDMVKRAAKPESFDPANPQQHVQYLNDGSVWLPDQVVFNEESYKGTLDKLTGITPEQKEASIAQREARLAALAPQYTDAMGADPEALDFYTQAKAEGKTDSEIATEWYGDPTKYSAVSNRLRSAGMGFVDATKGFVESIQAMAFDDKGAMDSLVARRENMARNEEFARLSGDSYGVGQSVLNTAPQVVADLLIAGGISAVATPAAGAALLGARTAGASAVRSLARSAVTSGTKSTLKTLVRGGAVKTAEALASLGDDLVKKMVTEVGPEKAFGTAMTQIAKTAGTQSALAASTFARAAGSSYVSTYSALDAQTLPNGTPRYTDEEKRRIALGAATVSGISTAAITLGFGAALGPGVEGLVSGKIGTSALRNVFKMSDDQIASASRSSALAILKSAGAEAPEEAVDQLLSGVYEKIATGEEFRLGPALKEALEAGAVGGILGAGAGAVQALASKPRDPAVAKLEAAGAPRTAAAVEARSNAPTPVDPVADLRDAATEVGARVTELSAQLTELKTDPEGNKGKIARVEKRLAEAKAEKTRIDFAVKNPDTIRMSAAAAQQRTDFEPAGTQPVEEQTTTEVQENPATIRPDAATPDRRTRALARVLVNRGVSDAVATRFASAMSQSLPEGTTLEEARDQIITAFKEAGGRFADEQEATSAARMDPQTWIAAGYTPEEAATFAELATQEAEAAVAEADTVNETVEFPAPPATETAAPVEEIPTDDRDTATEVDDLEDVFGDDGAAAAAVERAAQGTAPRPLAEAADDERRPAAAAAAGPDQPNVVDDDGDTANAQAAFFSNDESHVRFAKDSRGRIRLLGIYAEPSGSVRGRDMVKWLRARFPGSKIFVDEVAPDASGFWDKMQQEGLIDGWSEKMFSGKTVPIESPTEAPTETPAAERTTSEVDKLAASGHVPTHNGFMARFKVSASKASAMRKKLVEDIRALYPLVTPPASATMKTAQALGLRDLKKGKDQLQIPVFDERTAPFTNDPHITALQLSAGRSVAVPAGVSVNPSIFLSPDGKHVTASTANTGQVIDGAGQYNRPSYVRAAYVPTKNKPKYMASVATLPAAPLNILPRTVTYAGFEIDPSKTTEADLINHFFGSDERVKRSVRSLAPGLSDAEVESITNSTQFAFLREIREFFIPPSDVPATIDPSGFGKKTESYKKYLVDRVPHFLAAKTENYWLTDRGAPATPAYFVKGEISNALQAAGSRPKETVGDEQVSTDDIIDRAAARASEDPDVIELFQEDWLEGAVEGTGILIGADNTPTPDAAAEIAARFIRAMGANPQLRSKFNALIVDASPYALGNPKRISYAADIRKMGDEDAFMIGASAVFVRPELMRNVDFRAMMAPAVSAFTDAEVAANRETNKAAAADLKLDGDLRQALERIARVSTYPRRYRAIARAVLQMQSLPSLHLVDDASAAYAGFYSGSANSIHLNMASSNGRGLLDVLMHEMLHAATAEVVRNPQTAKARALRDKLERYRAAVAEVAPPDMQYAVSSLDEFITHAATDPRFQRIARETIERGRSVWDKIVEAVSSFFGITNRDFVSSLWGFINHGAEYTNRAEVLRTPVVLEARAAPVSRRSALRVRLTREALTDLALEQESWKDWYDTHQETLDEFFGEHASMFQDILAATSQAATVKSNVGLALKAFGQITRGEEIVGFLPAVRMNLEKLRDNNQLAGQKISAYRNANAGDLDEVVVDRHISRMLFGVDSPSKAQFAKGKKVLTEIATRLGWRPSQVQAALWAASIVKSGKTPESYADYLRKLDADGVVGQRIGTSPGGDGLGGGRGRFAPADTAGARGALNQAASTATTDTLDQYLPQPPEGMSYAFEGTRGKYLAYVSRSRPDTITINRAGMNALIEGLDPANARAIVRKIVNHEIAHHAAFSAFTMDEITEMASRLSPSDLVDIAAKYYGMDPVAAFERMEADMESGTLNEEALLDEYLRMHLEKITDGATTEDTIAFHSDNPGFVARFVRYLRDALAKLWAIVGGPNEDFATRVEISRLSRELRAIKNGHRAPQPVPLPKDDLGRDNIRYALSQNTDDRLNPEDAIFDKLQPSTIGTENPYSPASFLSKLFRNRMGDRRLHQYLEQRGQNITAVEDLAKTRGKALEKAIASEKPPAELVDQALGERGPTTTAAQDRAIQNVYESAIKEARRAKPSPETLEALAESRDAAIEDAGTDEAAVKLAKKTYDRMLVMAEADAQKGAVQEAARMKAAMRRAAIVETAREAKERISYAQSQLDKDYPKTGEAVRKGRQFIDRMSEGVSSILPDGTHIKFVVDTRNGVYLTMAYNLHHTDGDPLEILTDPDRADIVAAAKEQLMRALIEGRAEELIDEQAEMGLILGETEAREAARAELVDQGVDQTVVEDYLLEHGSKAVYHSGSKFSADWSRFMKQHEVPEALRALLGEITDPVQNLMRTAMNVGTLAASMRLAEDFATGGHEIGALVTRQQMDVFRKMIQTNDEQEFLSVALSVGFARNTSKPGYLPWETQVETEDGPATAYLPVWLIKARQERNIRYLDGFRPIAGKEGKYGVGRLSEFHAHPDVVGTIEEIFAPRGGATTDSTKLVEKMGNTLAGMTGVSLAIATLGSIGFFSRQIFAVPVALASNGINPVSKDVYRAIGTAMDIVTGKESYWKTRLNALGMSLDDLRPSVLKELVKTEIDKPGGLNFLEMLGKLVDKMAMGATDGKGVLAGTKLTEYFAKLGEVVSAIDSVAKIAAFFTELRVLQEAYPDKSQEWHETEAAETVKRTMQARSQSMPVFDALGKSSYGRLMSPFLRFRGEVFRLAHGIPEQAMKEIRSGIPALVKRGRTRMAGFSAAMAFSIAGPAVLSSLFGVGDDEEYALRQSLPPYLRGSSLIYRKSEDGRTVTSINTTYLNYLAMIGDPISRVGRAVLRGDASDAADEAAVWFTSQFLEDQIFAGAAFEVLRNETSDGRKITFETDDFADAVVKKTQHMLGSAFTPQVLKVADRAIRAANNGVATDAAFLERPIGIVLGHMAPVKPVSIDLNEAVVKAGRTFFETNRDIRTVPSQLKRRRGMGEDENVDIVDDWYRSFAALNTDMARAARGFESMGLAKPKIAGGFTESGFSKERSRELVFAGLVRAPAISPALRQDIITAGDAAQGAGAGVKRLQTAQKALRSKPPVIDVSD